jgi:protein-L-isoaspartate(D-aspartate) O-methyltransferase
MNCKHGIPITIYRFFLLIFALISGCQPIAENITPDEFPPPLTVTPGDYLDDLFTIARNQMVDETIVARGINNSAVIRAIRKVPRQEFVLPEYLNQAYEDHPLPIGYGQTISQPYIVAWMTELIELKDGEKVLEIGTGSGYQAAILAEMGNLEVYSVEIVPELAKRAADTLTELGYSNISLLQGDGYYGWSDHAPYDAIIVTAAPDHLPGPLVEQIKEGGRIVIPIGPPGGIQALWKFVKQNGELTAFNMGSVVFVPFTGGGSTLPGSSPVP